MEVRCLLACVLLAVLLRPAGAAERVMREWRRDRAPKLFGDKVAGWQLDARSPKVQRKLTHFHNRFRSRVKPRAANMLKMSWHRGAAKDAQVWAEECQLLVHANDTGRWQQNFGACGQNIFVSTHKVPWYFAIKSWFLEKDIFRFGSSKNNLTEVGHYTQMVWYSTHKVGCAWTFCKNAKPTPYYNYVCNYCPTGNYVERLGRPYQPGRPCSRCRRSCNSKKRLCTNSCPWSDRWSNCAQLRRLDRNWTCRTRGKPARACRATCRCHNRVH
ncbi:cysteine-rich secretory protein 2-like [Pollicipes pollicipes]|nr:cysteine-rich secretory protein 2-like [Pollicipes pollicipes]XP_037084624.1 cysteine-rich secretory protein 2-like [Pollicipes pollicipes]